MAKLAKASALVHYATLYLIKCLACLCIFFFFWEQVSLNMHTNQTIRDGRSLYGSTSNCDYLTSSRRRFIWLEIKGQIFRSLWENDPSFPIICVPSRHFSDGFMVSITSLKSLLIQHDVYFLYVILIVIRISSKIYLVVTDSSLVSSVFYLDRFAY